jgi:cytochrome b6-f complex iron-sulfur subunit
MSAIVLSLAVLITKAWTHVFTLGLAGDFGKARREQVASDLWEQAHDATAGRAVAFSVLSRLVRGMPADIAWRVFVAPRLHRQRLTVNLEEGRAMSVQPGLPFGVGASGIGWAATLAFLITPVSHSLAYAGAGLALIALIGWLLEARDTGDDAKPSAWPPVLAASIAAIALGVPFDGGQLGLALSIPATLAFSSIALRTLASRPQGSIAVSSVSPEVLQRHALAGDAIVLERTADHRVSRRTVLQGSAWLGIGAVLAATGGVIVDFLWQRNVQGFGGIVAAGNISKYPPGSKTKITAGKFWLVHLTPEQGGPGFLALWQKCPHLGCTVPWEPNFSFKDAVTNETKRGWFRCPCHQSTYDDVGVRVFGPAPRSMDRMALTIAPDGEIEVDTGTIEKGAVDNAASAVTMPQT